MSSNARKHSRTNEAGLSSDAKLSGLIGHSMLISEAEVGDVDYIAIQSAAEQAVLECYQLQLTRVKVPTTIGS